MRKDPDMIFLWEHEGTWHVDHEIEQYVAHDDATDEVKNAVKRLNANIAKDIRRCEHRY